MHGIVDNNAQDVFRKHTDCISFLVFSVFAMGSLENDYKLLIQVRQKCQLKTALFLLCYW